MANFQPGLGGNPALDVGQGLQRPVVSPDGKYVAVIVSEVEIYIISLIDICPGNRVVNRIVLPKAARTFLANASILRWSPETVPPGSSEDGKTTATSETDFAMTWLLLSDGNRVVALSAELRSPQMVESDPDNSEQSSSVLADYQIGHQYGEVTLAEFIFNHRHALVLFETNVHASIISLTKPQRDDIMNPKYPDSRAFAQSRDQQYFALLCRSKGQDQVSIFSLKDNSSDIAVTFSPRTADAQALQWSPNGDPVLALYDSASHGTKVVFFTAMGHPLKQLDLLCLSPSSASAVGVITLQWVAAGSSTVLAVADGHKSVLVRRQDNRSMQIQAIASFLHPEIIDGSRYLVWQETLEGPRSFTQQKIAFDDVQQDAVGEVNSLRVNADCSMISTKIGSHPKSIWIWQPHDPEPQVVITFREAIKQTLWHPTLPHVLIIITTQKEPRIYAWYNIAHSPAIGEVPIQTPKAARWEGEWLKPSANGRCRFMLGSSTAFEIGFLQGRGVQVLFDSMLRKDFLSDEEGEGEGEETSEIITPSKASKKVATNAEKSPKTDKAEAGYSTW